jgi:hypothetical protein
MNLIFREHFYLIHKHRPFTIGLGQKFLAHPTGIIPICRAPNIIPEGITFCNYEIQGQDI